MGKKKIVIDTNIYISSLGWGGNPKKIIDLAIKGEFEIIISKRQVDEIRTVLDYPKFGFTERQKQKFIEILLEIATIIETKEIKGVSDDPKDNIILEAANEIKIDYIITGDDDLLRLKEYKGAAILNAVDFLSLFTPLE